MGLIIRARKPFEGAAAGLEVAFETSRVSVFLLAAVARLGGSDALGLGLALTPLEGPMLARGARLVRFDAGLEVGLDRTGPGSSSCFAFDAAVGAIRCDKSPTGLRGAAGRAFFWSDSCFAAEEAVCAVRCAGNRTGTVGDLGPDLDGGDFALGVFSVLAGLFEGAGAALLFELAVLRRLEAVLGDLGEPFDSTGDRRLALLVGFGVAFVVVATLDGCCLVAVPLLFVAATGVRLVETGFASFFDFGSADMREASLSWIDEVALSGCSLCCDRIGRDTP